MFVSMYVWHLVDLPERLDIYISIVGWLGRKYAPDAESVTDCGL